MFKTTLQHSKVMAAPTLVGHSLGECLALQYVYDKLEPQPERTGLLDTAPERANASVQSVLNQAVQCVADTKKMNDPASLFTSKQVLHEKHGIDLPTAQWLASSYDLSTCQFEFDLQAAYDYLEDFRTIDLVEQLETVASR